MLEQWLTVVKNEAVCLIRCEPPLLILMSVNPMVTRRRICHGDNVSLSYA
uniref:Uncharacterized protein n=1 Tax=Anguilla anguilla TaxID=7936 RepID=A0A0E9UHX5_ANGAN